MTILRATTYQVVAKGDCPCCENAGVELRFCYNPYGDDQLMCVPCAERQDESEREFQNHE